MKLAIVTDSTCDWSSGEYEKNDVTMIPLKILIDGETFLDQTEISSEEFYDRMLAAEGVPATSQPSPGDFIELYSGLVDKGYDSILSIHIAPVLSGTLQSASIAASSIDVPVVVFDSKSVSSGLGLLVQRAVELRDEGESIEAIVAKLEEQTRGSELFLAPENTDNLVKGGRITEDQAQGAALLNIKLVFSLDEDGRLFNFDKVKGSKGVIKRYVEIIKGFAEKSENPQIRFMHARNQEEIDALVSALEEEGVNCQISSIDVCGATVATHTGVGVIGFGISPAK